VEGIAPRDVQVITHSLRSQVGKQSFDKFETTASHPNLTCVTQIFHATESGLEEKAGMTMAKIIEFHIPNNFRKRVKWVSPEQRGKVIEFASPMKKSA
jgi:hypothetical protein